MSTVYFDSIGHALKGAFNQRFLITPPPYRVYIPAGANIRPLRLVYKHTPSLHHMTSNPFAPAPKSKAGIVIDIAPSLLTNKQWFADPSDIFEVPEALLAPVEFRVQRLTDLCVRLPKPCPIDNRMMYEVGFIVDQAECHPFDEERTRYAVSKQSTRYDPVLKKFSDEFMNDAMTLINAGMIDKKNQMWNDFFKYGTIIP